MGYNARNDEIRDNVTRMQREWEASLIYIGPRKDQENDCRCAKECYLARSKMVISTTLFRPSPAIWRPQFFSSLLVSEFGRFLSLSRGPRSSEDSNRSNHQQPEWKHPQARNRLQS